MKRKFIFQSALAISVGLLMSVSSMAQLSFTSSNVTQGVKFNYGLASADFNGDGRADLVVNNSGNGSGTTVGVYLANSSGAFTSVVYYPAPSNNSSVITGDVNGDGFIDIIAGGGNVSVENVVVLTNSGSGSFGKAPATAYSATWSFNVEAGDVNGDGKLDIVSADLFGSPSGFSVLTNTGNGTFNSFVNYDSGNGASSVAIGDLNGDGKPDLAETVYYGNQIKTWINQGNGTFTLNQTFGTGSNPYKAIIKDLNGDGFADIAFTTYGSSTIEVYLNSGSGGTVSFNNSYNTGFSPRLLAIDDINGDGKPEMVTANENQNTISVFTNTGTGFSSKIDYTTGTKPISVVIADFNNDGKKDLAASTYNDNVNFLNIFTNTSPNITTAITGVSPSQSVCNGTNTILSVTATGATNLAYQWFKNGVAINGATASIYSITGITNGSLENYNVVVKGFGSTVTSSGISLTSCNNALAFGGNPNKVTIPFTSDIQVGTSTDFTLEAWVKYTGNATDYTGIISRANGGTPFYQLCLVGNKIAAEFNPGVMVGVSQGLQGTTLLNDNNWHHLALVANRATQNIRLYVDGNVEANVTNSNVAGNLNASVDYLIGVERGSNLFLTGAIDEVRIWHTALTQQDLQNNRYKNLNATVTSLMAYYDFNQGIDGGTNTGLTSLTDKSGYNRTGTLNSFSLTGSASNWVSASTTTFTGAYSFAAPSITGITSSQTVCSGVTVPLAVTVNTVTGLAYQWYKNGAAISGATTFAYTINSVTSTGSYFVVVTSLGGNITSAGINVVVGCNNALNFDGSSSYANAGSFLTPSYTKEAWVNISSQSAINNFVSGGDFDGTHAFWAPASNGSKLSAGHNGSFTVVQDVTPLNINTWYHMAVTYDANTSLMSLYKNGILVSQGTIAPYINGNFVRLGAYSDNSNLLQGSLDEVRIWNTALSAADIQANMYKTVVTNLPSLLASYNFNQGIASGSNAGQTLIVDNSGQGRNATLVGFALTGAILNYIASLTTVSGAYAFTSPTITGLTSSQSVTLGATLPLNVTATGSGLGYRWLKNSAVIPSAVSSNYTLSNISSTSAGTYLVVVTLLGGNITSSGINITYTKASQTILGVAIIPTLTVGGANYSITGVSASSGLPVTITSSNLSVLNLTSNLLMPQSAGTSTITYAQAGDANYLATSSTQTATVVSGILTATSTETNLGLAEGKLYPNPNNGSFMVESAEASAYQVLSLEGAVLQSGLLNIGNNFISTSLVKGFYLFRTSTKTFKLLVE